MFVLEINGDFGRVAHDPSAFIYKNGELLFAVEEERINRVRFSEARMPENAIRACLEYCNITMKDIDIISIPQDTWGDFYINRVRNFLNYKFGYCPNIKIYNHHLAHAASTYYNSGFKEALIVTADGSGDGISTSIYEAKNENIYKIKSFGFPNSFGTFYSAITQLLGYTKNADEYKIMGLSAYGKNIVDFEDIIKIENKEYFINSKIFDNDILSLKYPLHITKQDRCFSDWLSQKLDCKPRRVNDEITQKHKDIAASAQKKLEETMIQLILYYISSTKHHNICLAGGVFMNCLLNGKINDLQEVNKLYVPPVCDDSGTAMGAAILCMLENGYNIKPIQNPYYGDSYSDEKIRKELDLCGIEYEDLGEELYYRVALELEKGNIIGWFQGRMEIGSRALGNRSILANPQYEDMKDKVNKIKKREIYQPFAPAVLEEDKYKYFNIFKKSSDNYMTVTYSANERAIKEIPAVVHIDSTSRVQTVTKENNNRFYQLLNSFKDKTGCSVILNTSLNRKGEPIARTINEALAILYSTNLDGLGIGSCFISKHRN